MTGDLIRAIWTQGNRYTEIEDSHVKTDPETGMMGLRGKDCQQPPEARKKQTRFFPRALGERKHGPSYTLISNFELLEW